MRRLMYLAVVALTAVACSGGGDRTVTLTEFDIDMASTLPAGATTLAVANDGEFAHSLVVSRSDGTVVASTDVIDPGSTASLGVDFAPGEYVFTCRIVVEVPEGGLIDHYAEGMEATVTIEG